MMWLLKTVGYTLTGFLTIVLVCSILWPVVAFCRNYGEQIPTLVGGAVLLILFLVVLGLGAHELGKCLWGLWK
jgi:predicted PurR-regulated permease PerM